MADLCTYERTHKPGPTCVFCRKLRCGVYCKNIVLERLLDGNDPWQKKKFSLCQGFTDKLGYEQGKVKEGSSFQHHGVNIKKPFIGPRLKFHSKILIITTSGSRQLLYLLLGVREVWVKSIETELR